MWPSDRLTVERTVCVLVKKHKQHQQAQRKLTEPCDVANNRVEWRPEMKQGLWFSVCVYVCVCVWLGVRLFIIHTESLLDKFLMCREIQRFEASGMLGVATIKLLCLQIRGVSFKKKRDDVNSKRHRCLAWFLQYNGLLGGVRSHYKTQFTCLRCSVYSLGISWCFYPEIYNERAGTASLSCCKTHKLLREEIKIATLKPPFDFFYEFSISSVLMAQLLQQLAPGYMFCCGFLSFRIP